MIFKFGTSGNEVKKIQEELHRQGYDVGKFDGIFGKKTEDIPNYTK